MRFTDFLSAQSKMHAVFLFILLFIVPSNAEAQQAYALDQWDSEVIPGVNTQFGGINALAHNGTNTWMAITGEQQVLTSSDGFTWIEITSNFDDAGITDPNNLTYDNGRWKISYTDGIAWSENNGATWIKADNPPSSAPTNSLSSVSFTSYASKGDVWIGFNFDFDGHAFFITTDNGETWTKEPVSSIVGSIAFGEDDRVVAVGTDIAYSDDDGDTWVSVTNPATQQFTELATDGDGNWVAAGTQSVAYSSDNGATWQLATTNLVSSENITALAYGSDFEGNPAWTFKSASEFAIRTKYSVNGGVAWNPGQISLPTSYNINNSSQGQAAYGPEGFRFTYGDLLIYPRIIQIPDVIELVDPNFDNQIVSPGQTINLAFRVKDTEEEIILEQSGIVYGVLSGGGSLGNDPESTTVGPMITTNGTASVNWTVGTAFGVNTMKAGIQGTTIETIVTATVVYPAPTNLFAIPGTDDVEIFFQQEFADNITNYEYQLDDGTWQALSPADGASPITISGLTQGIEVGIRLRATDGTTSGLESEQIFVTPGGPSAPTGLSASGIGEAVIAFTEPEVGGPFTNYQYSIDGGAWQTFSPPVTTSPVTISPLTDGQEYSIRLRAVNSAGTGPASEPVTAIPGTFVPNISLSPETNAFKVTITNWQDFLNSDPGQATQAGVQVNLTANGVTTSYQANFSLSDLNAGEFIFPTDGGFMGWNPIPSVVGGQEYQVSLQLAYESVQNPLSPVSNTAAVTPEAPTPPPVPQITNVIPGDQTLTLQIEIPAGSSWNRLQYQTSNGTWQTAQVNPSFTSFTQTEAYTGTAIIEYDTAFEPFRACIDADGNLVVGLGESDCSMDLNTGEPTGNTWGFNPDAKLVNGTLYGVRLRTLNLTTGPSEVSEEVSGTPEAPSAPEAPQITGVTPDDQILTLDFTVPAGAAWDRIEYQTTGGIYIAGVIDPVNSGLVTEAYTGTITIDTDTSQDVFQCNQNGTIINWLGMLDDDPDPPIYYYGFGTDPTDAGLPEDLDEYFQIDEFICEAPFLANGQWEPNPDAVLVNGTAYNVKIRAFNSINNLFAESNEMSGTPAGIILADAPSGVTVTPGDEELTVDFDAPANVTISDVEYRIAGTDTWVSIGATEGPFTIGGLTNGLEVGIELRAIDDESGLPGTASEPVTGTPVGAQPEAPSNVTVTPGDEELTVDFDAPANVTISDVEYRIAGTDTWVSIGDTEGPFTIGGLTNDVEVGIELRAISADSTAPAGQASEPVTGTPGGAAELAFVDQPQSAAVGESTGTITVEILDLNGDRVTSSTESVTLALGSNPAAGTLAGTLTVQAVNGLATFSGLSVNKAAAGYTLTANAGGLPETTSDGFAITQKALSITGSFTAEDKTYDGTAEARVNGSGLSLSGLADGSDEVRLNLKAEFSQTDAGEDLVVTLIGTTLAGDDKNNYTLDLSGAPTGTASITPAELTVIVNSDAKFVTTGDPGGYQGVSITGFVAGDGVSVVDQSGLQIVRSNSSVEAPGEYEGVLVASGLAADNYEFTYQAGDFTIVPADELLVKVDPVSVEYGTEPSYSVNSAGYFSSTGQRIVDLTGNVAIQDGQVSLTDGAGGSAQFDVTATGRVETTSGELAVGNYTLGASNVTGSSDNFSNNLILNGSLTVTKRQISAIVADGQTKPYDGEVTMPGLDLDLDGLISGDVVGVTGEGAYSTKMAGENKEYIVGSLTLTGADAANYTLGAATEVIGVDGVITPIALQLAGASDVSKPFDGTRAMPSGENGYGSLQGLVSGDQVTVAGSPRFSQADPGTGLAIEQGTVSLTGSDAPNYTLSWSDGTGAITAARLLVRAIDASRFVVETEDTDYAGVSISGFVNGDGPEVADLSDLQITRSNDSVNDPGAYSGVLVPSGVSSSNYEIEYEAGNYTIVPADQLKVEVTPASTVYGSEPDYVVQKAAYYSSTGEQIVDLTDGVTISGAQITVTDGASGSAVFDLSPQQATQSGAGELNVGAYTIAAGNVTQTSANFSNSLVVTGALTVTAREITAKAVDGLEKEYDAQTGMIGLSLDAEGALEGDRLTITGDGSYSSKAAGTDKAYVIEELLLDGQDAGNYTLAQNSISGSDGEVTKRDLQLTVVATPKVYDGTTEIPASVTDNRLSGDEFTVSFSASLPDKNVGSDRPVTITGVTLSGADADNYQAVVNSPTTSVTPFDITVSADAGQFKGAGEDDPEAFTYSVDPDLFAGDSFTGSLTRASGETQGSYALQLGTLSAGPNYRITFVPATFEIRGINIVTDALDEWIERKTGFSQTLEARFGTEPYTWSVDEGSDPLPAGMTLSDDGVLSGTPEVPGTYSFIIVVTDANGLSQAKVFTFEVSEAVPNLLFTQSPSETTEAGFNFGEVSVEVRNQAGDLMDWYEGDVTLSVVPDTLDGQVRTAELFGTATLSGDSGSYTYTDLYMTKAGEAFRLQAEADGAVGGVSDAFTITPGPPWALALVDQTKSAAGQSANAAGRGDRINTSTYSGEEREAAMRAFASAEAGLEGSRLPVEVIIYDEYDNETFYEEGDAQIELSTNSASGNFFTRQTETEPTRLITIPVRQSKLLIFYEDIRDGLATLSGQPTPPPGGRQILPAEEDVVIRRPAALRAVPDVVQTEAGQLVELKVELLSEDGFLVNAPFPGVELTVDNVLENVELFGDEQGSEALETLLIMPAENSMSLWYRSFEPGVDQITYQAVQLGAVTAEQTIEVSTGTIDPDNSFVEVVDGFAGEQIPLTITLRDAFGNAITGLSGSLEVEVAEGVNPGTAYDDVQETAPGVYSTFYEPLNAGQDSVAVELSGQPLLDAPYVVSVLTGEASELILVSGDEQEDFIENELDEPLVTRVLDSNNNPIQGITVRYRFTDTPEGAKEMSITPRDMVTNENGVAETAVTLGNKSGTYTVEALVVGVDPVVFTLQANTRPIVLDSNSEQYSGPYSFKITPNNLTPNRGDVVPVTAQLVDENDNHVAWEGLRAEWSTTNSFGQFADTTLTAVTDENGAASILYLVGETVGTRHVLSLTTTGVTQENEVTIEPVITGTSREIRTMGAPLGGYQIVGPGRLKAGELSGAFTLQLVDTTGAPFAATEDFAFRLQMSESEQVEFYLATDDSLGQAQKISDNRVSILKGDTEAIFRIRQRAVGQKVISGTQVVGITRLEGEDKPVLFDPGPISDLILLSGNDQTGDVDSFLEESLEVKAEDEFGNPIEGLEIVWRISEVPLQARGYGFSSDSDNSILEESVIVSTDAEGVSSITFRFGDVAGTYFIYANASNSAAKQANSVTQIDDVVFRLDALPNSFEIYQNYPNPFRDETTVPIELPVDSEVTLDLFDVTGSRVQLLLNAEELSAGRHLIVLDARSLASDVYILRMIAKGSDGRVYTGSMSITVMNR